MKGIIAKNQKFYILSIFFLFVLLSRQITDLYILDFLGNSILAPLFLGLFLLLSINERYDFKKIIIILLYATISFTASLIMLHYDYMKIFSEIISLLFFLVVIPSIKISEIEIYKLFRMICLLSLVLIIIKGLIYFDFSVSEQYLFLNKNSWAQSLLFPMIISYYISQKFGNKKYGVLSFLLFVLIVFSFARTAIIAAITFFTIYFVFSISRKMYKLILISFMLLIVLQLDFINENLYSFYSDNYIRSDNNLLTNRDVLWEVAIDTFKTSPIFGVGRDKAGEIIMSSGIGMNNSEYHSFYLEVLAYGGVFSFIFYIYLLISVYINGIRLFRINKQMGKIVISATTAMLIYMVAETFYPFGFSYNNAIAGLLLFSIPLSYLRGNVILRDSES